MEVKPIHWFQVCKIVFRNEKSNHPSESLEWWYTGLLGYALRNQLAETYPETVRRLLEHKERSIKELNELALQINYTTGGGIVTMDEAIAAVSMCY